MKSVRGSMLVLVIGILVGAEGMYLYRDNSVAVSEEVESLKREHRREIEQFREAEAAHKVEEREFLRAEQQANALYEEGLKRIKQINRLKQDRLRLVCRLGDSERARELLALDPQLAREVFSDVSQENFLHQVARSGASGSGKIAEALIDYGADRSAKNVYGQSPIDVARVSNAPVLQVLLTYQPKQVVRVSLNSAP
jgi:hypothetical protein